MTISYISVPIPVRKIPYDELPQASPDNPFRKGLVGIFTTEEELLGRYGGCEPRAVARGGIRVPRRL